MAKQEIELFLQLAQNNYAVFGLISKGWFHISVSNIE